MCVVEEKCDSVLEELGCESDDIFSDTKWISAVKYN
jgi:hypothetical protein